jgi:hypothetical protein
VKKTFFPSYPFIDPRIYKCEDRGLRLPLSALAVISDPDFTVKKVRTKFHSGKIVANEALLA